ncbi:Scopoletin glucosyltransferase [Bienertia sinuspersici]
MANEPQQLHVVFFPFMAPGHMIPTLDIANLFVARGVKASIITTPLNVPFFAQAASMIDIEVFKFPTPENGCETLKQAMKCGMVAQFLSSLQMLREQLEQYLDKVRPHCLVADMFLSWTTDSAAKFNVPRVVFHGTCNFALCAEEIVRLHEPYNTVSSDDEPFAIPFIPHDIQMTRLQFPDFIWKNEPNQFRKGVDDIKASEVNSFGVIVNSFYELETEYANFFTNNLGRRAWNIGPVSLCNRRIEGKALRGKEVSRNEDAILEWLSSKPKHSAFYICTGSLASFTPSQLHQIAIALERSKQDFVWVVKNDDEDEKSTEEWLPPGFEQRTKGKGLIIRGWAPQVLILEHEAIGAFVTHCGWNSILECISAGVPMVTWPSAAEQFYNEKLVTEILKIGVPIGAKKWCMIPYEDDLIKHDMIEKALLEIMEGDEAQERRNKFHITFFPFMAHDPHPRHRKNLCSSSFYELETEYANFFTNNLGRRAWNIGPVSLCNRRIEGKALRGKEVSRNEDAILEWLSSKRKHSAIYICTGSLASFTPSQLHQIAIALEGSKQDFVWVVKNDDEDEKSTEEWLPPGFEQRTKGKGLIIRGWAPQVLILEHDIGAFVTHCGWNSILESISAGVPMVTWPSAAEQFYNEKLVTEILKIGVPIGAKRWCMIPYEDDLIKHDMIEKALREIMEGDEAQERRNMVKKLKEMAQKALHVTFFPFMAHGHMIPILDIARLFAARGVKTTIITTPVNLPSFTKQIKKVGDQMIDVEVFSFPCTENSLPEGCETVNQAITLDLVPNFFKAVEMLKEQLEQYLHKVQPDCLVADMFLPWATDCAAKFDIPRLVFHAACYFSLCAEEMARLHMPYMNVSSDEEPFTIPNLPHEIRMTRMQIPHTLWNEELTELKNIFTCVKESELKSYGVIVNSFYELEPEYADFFGKNLGRRAWHIGSALLRNRSIEDKEKRGDVKSRLEDKCLKWLDSKKHDSVVYICCGSIAYFNTSQLHEIAMALETSQQEFIWVVKEDEDGKSTNEYFPEGFEQRNEGKGLIIRGWAPQLLLLEHEAIGAFLTHCGWNSILESISAGVPMVTWPIFAEQFYNEKLVTEILKIGVPVGAKKWSLVPHIIDLVKHDAIEKALREIMEGDEAIERRNMAKNLKEMALKAVEEDGSSCSDLGALINELREYHA